MAGLAVFGRVGIFVDGVCIAQALDQIWICFNLFLSTLSGILHFLYSQLEQFALLYVRFGRQSILWIQLQHVVNHDFDQVSHEQSVEGLNFFSYILATSTMCSYQASMTHSRFR